MSISRKTATVIGATGLVGSEILKVLEAHPSYERIYVLARGDAPPNLSGKVIYRDWPDLSAFEESWASAEGAAAMDKAIEQVLPKGDDFFSALGTTRAAAGSAERFQFVDLAINRSFARAAITHGYSQYLLVSAVNADAASFFLYPKSKGQLELAVSVLPYWSIHFFRPGLLVGPREKVRVGEQIAEKLLKGLTRIGFSARASYQTIDAETVAKSMVDAAQMTDSGTFVYFNEEMADPLESTRRLRAN